MKVINLFAGPGAGKSTTAAGLFNLMKNSGYSVELVTEVAKDFTWESNKVALDNQLYVLALQFHRLFRLRDKVDYVITDSPILLSLLYTPPLFDKGWFKEAVFGVWNIFPNISFYIQRTKPYVTTGRSQTEAEARQLDADLRWILYAHRIEHSAYLGDRTAPVEIFRRIKELENDTRGT